MAVSRLFVLFLLYRLGALLFSQTWFVPDEHWQSQEVAHYLAFNYGYLTWEWRVGIRSYLYPLVIATVYKLLNLLGLDQTDLLIYAAPLMQSALGAWADLLYVAFVRRFYGSRVAHVAAFCRAASWFTMYTSGRTLSNGVEEALTIACLAALRVERGRGRAQSYAATGAIADADKANDIDSRNSSSTGSNQLRFWRLHAAAFTCCLVRATAPINLAPIYIYQFFWLIGSRTARFRFIVQFVCVGLFALIASVLIDSWLHGALLVAPYNFLLYNIYYSVAAHYGTHPWHWYLTQGYPTLLGAHVLLFAAGGWWRARSLLFPFAVIGVNLAAYSLLGHKEFRFLSQTAPLAMLVCALGLEHIRVRFGRRSYRVVATLTLVANLALAVFVGLVHQRAPLSLMRHLRSEQLQANAHAVLFLTPCHSTPYYSFLHRNVSMRFLTCEPPSLPGNAYTGLPFSLYEDEADAFFLDPQRWFVANRDRDQLHRVTHLALFANLYERLLHIRTTGGDSIGDYVSRFQRCGRFFHALTAQSRHTDTHLLLLCRNQSLTLTPNFKEDH